MKDKRKQVWLHVGIIVLCFVIACAYFAPALSGLVIRQGDTQKAEAMGYEQEKVAQQTGTTPNWNSTMFSGMPGYQTAIDPQPSLFQAMKVLLIMRPLGLERNIGILFLYLIGFYVALLAFGVGPWLSLLGALAFGLGSYNIIIVEAGHITKAWAISMMAPILGAMVLTLRGFRDSRGGSRRWWRTPAVVWGFVLVTVALGLQITFNHIQITYYTMIGAVILGITYLVYAAKERWMPQFAAAVGVLLLGCVMAFGSNVRHLLVNEEYGRYTMRGGSELTVTPKDLYQDEEPRSIASTTSGLDRDYAFGWSYGIGETYTLLVPGAMGGGSAEQVGDDSESYKAFRQHQAPLYWGDQPFTSGPVYFGAIIIFLFVLGLFVVRGPERWWLLVATLLAIVMSWGRNLMGLNEWLFNTLPLYNKFRTPSMTLVLANVTMVLMAVLALKEFFARMGAEGKEGKEARKKLVQSLFWSAGITAGVLVIGLIASGNFSYSGAADEQMAQQYGAQWPMLQDIFIKDRKSLFRSDSLRSLLFVAVAAVVLWLCATEKLKKATPAVLALAVLVLIDMWGVDRRYLNNDNFTEARKLQLSPDAYDFDIDRTAAQYGDHDYRVFNLAVNTFNDSKPCAFHHQIGGYSAAKLRRYQDLIDFYLSRHINPQVLNMLNTRYFVVPEGGQQGYAVQRNVAALGNAWFVDECKWVANANEEIMVLNDFDPEHTAVVDRSQWGDQVKADHLVADSAATIVLTPTTPYTPDYLRYESHRANEGLAVFSEIYYAPDWFAYVDGKPAPYFRANYVLRAMMVPAGDHVIEFRNEAPRLHKLNRITLLCSVLTGLVLAAALVLLYVPKRGKGEAEGATA